MKTKDVRELSVPEIEKELRDTREEMLNLRLRKETGQVENPTRIRLARREIARLETIRSQKAEA
jgi:large subunit ribosomal protein L29